ncbi:MAG: exonuclease SbcCD subunit D [Anaerobacillus sp.]|uniref:metallophosphoesterase family protein n=1 Tax=Anaerobacillus sp. TaxID=1872506 RepID=UPI00391DA661
MKKTRFIHAADLHLDSPFQGLSNLPIKLLQEARESTFEALQKLVAYAIKYQVDFVIFAGDLFDGEDRSLKAQSKFKKAMEELQEYGIHCYIIHGNHDHLKGNWVSISWPDNVFFFKAEVDVYKFRKADLTVHLYGYSYPQKTVKDNIAVNYQRIGEADFHIGILHGTADGQEGHDHYAPFSVQQLVEKEFDYWALGHIHKRQVLHENPFVVYSGNFQGRHKKELGDKGIYFVELDHYHSSTLTFLPTSELHWEELTVSIEGIETIDELKNRCELSITEAKKCDRKLFVILRFVGSGPLHNYLTEGVAEFIEVLNWGQEEKEQFAYIVDKKLETIGEWDRQQIKKEQHLLSDIITACDRLLADQEPLVDALAEVFSNQKLKRYLTPFTEEEQKQLLLEAESYILTEFLKERDE